ncbi:MAG: hypothetical protein QM831_33540 [Kofleriaceae bacterium]
MGKHLAFVMLAFVAACGDDGGNNNTKHDAGSGSNVDSGTTPGACTQTITAKTTMYASDLSTASAADPAKMTGSGDVTQDSYGGHYRDDLVNHPGCKPRTSYTANMTEPFVTDNEATVPAGTPANIPGYPCAAEEYTQPNEDTSKPIVILVHGNSSGVGSFEEYAKSSIAGTMIMSSSGFQFTVDSTTRPQLATKLIAAGYKVYAFDARTDLVKTLVGYSAQTNAFSNMDHGWGVPMLQSMIKAVMIANPTRKVSIIGHSLGTTDIRDALRRLYNEHKAGAPGSVNPFAQLKDAIYLSGANHGVVAGNNCDLTSTNMKITVLCEMGDRAAFQPTYFSSANNGPHDIWTTPCADGDYAFGDHDACGGNVVQYTTVTMQDIAAGSFQDEFVSEASASLDNDGCVTNVKDTLDDYDRSGYFFNGNNGFFASHFGSARSDAGMTVVLGKLAD